MTLYYEGAVRLGDDVVIRVKRYSNNQVRLAINAPRNLSIERIPAGKDISDAANNGTTETNSKEIPVFRKRKPAKDIQSS